MWEFLANARAAMAAIFRMEQDMGAIADQLASAQAQMDKAKAEILAKIAAGTMDDADRAALDKVRATAQEFDDIVPDPEPPV